MASKSEELAKTNHHVFHNREGAWHVEGKVYYPDYITVIIDRHKALALLSQIANGLQYDDDEFMLLFAGALKVSEE